MPRVRLLLETLAPRVTPAVGSAVGAAAGADPTVTAFAADGGQAFQVRPFATDFRGGVRVALGDVTGDGNADIVAAAGPGGVPFVAVLDGVTGSAVTTLTAFEDEFRGGVFVAVGDFDRDGFADLVLSPDEGGGPRVRVLGGKDGRVLADFFGIDDPAFRGGARTAVGDVNGDGTVDLVVAAGFGGGPRVAAFDGRTVANGSPATLFGDYFAFESTLRNGAFVAAGDLDGDGLAEVVAGGGPGGGPRVLAFGGQALLRNQQVPVANFFAGDTSDRGGVRVAVGSVDGSPRVLTAGPGGTVRAYTVGGADGSFPGANSVGGFVAATTVTGPIVSPPPTSAPVTFEDTDWAYYEPSDLVAGRTYPVLFAFHPGGDAHGYDAVLRPLAEERKWIVAGSKYYQNGLAELGMTLAADGSIATLGDAYTRLRDAITSAVGKVPADTSRVVLYGQSGGGSVSHALSLAYPGLAAALIINTGMIWGDTVIGPNPGESGPVNGPYWNRYLDQNAAALANAFAANGSRRLTAFLESPTDFRFEEMRADKDRMRSVGWQVNRLEFAGGHAVAPLDTLRQAAAWIAGNPAWQ